MDLQVILVGICLLLAIAFMTRKVIRTLRGRNTCSCDCGEECATHGRGCTGGAECSCGQKLEEIQAPGRK